MSSFIREIKLYRGGASWAPPPTAIKERMIHMDMVFDLIATLVACMCCPSAAAKVVNEAESAEDVSAERIFGNAEV